MGRDALASPVAQSRPWIYRALRAVFIKLGRGTYSRLATASCRPADLADYAKWLITGSSDQIGGEFQEAKGIAARDAKDDEYPRTCLLRPEAV